MKYCFGCMEELPSDAEICEYCGLNQYGPPNREIVPTKKAMKKAQKILRQSQASINRAGINQTRTKKEKRGLTDAEILALGLYPDDEGYKMSLISRILGRK